MPRLFLIFLLFVSAEFIHAQESPYRQGVYEKTTLSGTIIDEAGEVIPYASVAVYKSADSTLAAGAASDDQGKFSISVNPGEYFLKITFLSFDEKVLPGIVVEKEAKDIGTITLQSKEQSLDEVVVQGEKSEMQLHLDKRVFNVGKDLANTGSNAAEILDNVPSVSVDIDGNVSLRGSQNVRILIDGKPSGLTGISSTDALRQLQGNLIESIEVITNPSARYDAEGETGIINIVLKKEQRTGVNGSFEVHTGYPHNHGVSLSINYRKKKFNLFANYGLNYRNAPGKGYSRQEFTEPDTSYSYESIRNQTRGALSNMVQVGTDLFLDKTNTLTLSGSYRYNKGLNEAKLTYKDYDDLKNLTGTSSREDDEEENRQNIEADVNYRKDFKRKSQQLTADIKWTKSDDLESSHILESQQDSLFTKQRYSNTENQQNWLAQTDYVHPFKKEGRLETGAKATFRTVENDYTVEELSPNDTWQILQDFDNHFIYQENIYAAYILAGNKWRKLSYQAGVRFELSDIATELKATSLKNRRTYFDFFPSAHLSYEIKNNNTIQLSYSRRLSRPFFRFLLPFHSYSDNRNIRTGNPDLDPEYTHALELGHLKYWDKGSLLSSIYYRYTTGVIERVFVPDSATIVKTIPVNLSKQHAVGIEFSASYNPLKWWKLTANFNFDRALTQGEYLGEKLSSEAFRWGGRISSKMTIAKKLDFQTSFNYRAPNNTTQGKTKSRYFWDAGLSMDVLKGNGTLALSGKDLLNSNKRRSVTESDGYYSESEFQWRSRQILLSFSYRLNQKKQKGERRSEGEMEGGDDMGF